MAAHHPSSSWIESGREAGLLLLAHQGDTAAFGELLRAHLQPLHSLCFALVCNGEGARHLMCETASLAWRSIGQLPVGRPFYPFIARIARNLAVAHQRRGAGIPRKLSAQRPSGEPWGGSTGNPALIAEEQRLVGVYQELSPDERLLLALRLVQGLTYPRIAVVLDVPIGSVMHRLQALRARFESASRAEAA